MKTTLDLPDGLMREVKIRAMHEQKKLKDAIAEFIRKGMAAGENARRKRPSRSSYAVARSRQRKSKRRSRGVAIRRCSSLTPMWSLIF